MDMFHLTIPYDFLIEKIDLHWGDLAYAIRNELVSPNVALRFVNEVLAQSNDVPSELIELGDAKPGERILHLIDALAAQEAPSMDRDYPARWHYLALAWVLANIDTLADPLAMVELIYADFGYPEKMAHLVRYMPTTEPDLGSREANEEQMMRAWRQYVEDRERAYRHVES